MAVDMNVYVVSNEVADDSEELRRRMDRSGYLFFRELLDPGQVQDLRRDVLEVCQRGGWLKEGAPLVDGIANGERTYLEPEPDYLEVYDGVQRLESFHKLAHAPEILDLMGKMVGEEVLPHATKIARLMFPQNNQFATPPHQDFVHIQGSTETYSCWMPLGDCPRELGGLSVLAGSHQQGVFEYHPELGAGGMGVDAEYLAGEWLTTDYRAGDALIFHSMTVHKSLPNTTLDRMRFSVDYRYQAASQPIVEAYLGPHNVKSSWEEIYSGWKSKDLQYYWQNLDVKIGERDWSYYDKRDAEAMELAKKGDPIGRSALTRIIARDPRPEKKKAAEEALRMLAAVTEGKG